VSAIPVFYGDEMLADSDSRSPSARKPESVVAAWKKAGLAIEMRPIVPATVEELCLAHDPSFVRSILASQAENGFGNTREDVARSLPYTNGAMICATSLALDTGIACAPVSGFHHAGYATATMFCTFNGLMIATVQLLRAGRVRRVLVLDCDYHYGNGTDEIIERLALTSKVENATFGRWYRTKSHAKLYLQQLERTSERFGEFDLVLYQAGADVHVDDPLGGVLDSEQMRQRDRIVFEAAKTAAVPLAWDLAGGYQVPVSKVIKLHVATMEECVRVYALQ
jgi:acetoin utilization deacetylase AcuC-like enzyme